MSNKHTPGPWRADGTHIQTPVGGRIAYMANRDEQALADARLIAAAPEMLALLDQAHSALQMAIASKEIGWFQDAVLADIGALLSRIEGETE